MVITFIIIWLAAQLLMIWCGVRWHQGRRTNMSKPVTVCGRVHLGPEATFNDPYLGSGVTCLSCGKVMTEDEMEAFIKTRAQTLACMAKALTNTRVR